MNLDENERKVLYLATLFTHDDPATQEYRYKTSCRVAAKLIQHGIVVFNPLSHSVPIVPYLGDVDDPHPTWMGVDLPILRRSDEVLILGLDNWTESRGVKAEMFEAMAYKIPITLIEEKDIDLLPLVPKTALRFLKSEILKEAVDAH